MVVLSTYLNRHFISIKLSGTLREKGLNLEFVHQTEKHVGPLGTKQTQQHPKKNSAFGDLSIDRTCVC